MTTSLTIWMLERGNWGIYRFVLDQSVVLIFLTSMIFVLSFFVISLSRTGNYPVIKGNSDIVTRFVIGLSGWSCRICDSLHGPGFRDTIWHKIVHSRIKRKILTANSASGIVDLKTRQPVLVTTRSRLVTTHIFQARDKSRYNDVSRNSPDFSHVDICVRTEQDTYDNSVNGIATLYVQLVEKWFHENCEESTRRNVWELRCEQRLLLFENMYDTASKINRLCNDAFRRRIIRSTTSEATFESVDRDCRLDRKLTSFVDGQATYSSLVFSQALHRTRSNP